MISVIAVVTLAAIFLMSQRHGFSRSDIFYADMSVTSLYEEGKRFLEDEKPDSALSRFVRIKQKYTPDLDDGERRLSALASYEAGRLYYSDYSDYKSAFDCYSSSKEISEENGYEDLLPEVYTDLASVYYVFRDVETSLEFTKKGYRFARKENEPHIICRSMSNLVVGSYDYGMFDSIQREIKDFERFEPSQPDDLYGFTSELVKSAQKYAEGNYKGALAEIDSAIMIARRNDGLRRQFATALSVKTYILQRSRDFNQAIKTARMMETTDILDQSDVEISYLQFLTRLYNMAGKTDSSHIYALKYIDVSESLFGSKAFGNIKDVESSRKIEKADRQIHILEIERHFHRVLILVFAVVTLIVTYLLVILVKQKRDLRNRNEELFRKNEEFMKEISVERDRFNAYRDLLRETGQSPAERQQEENNAVTDKDVGDADEEMLRLAGIISDLMENDEEVLSGEFQRRPSCGKNRSITEESVSCAQHCVWKKLSDLSW